MNIQERIDWLREEISLIEEHCYETGEYDHDAYDTIEQMHSEIAALEEMEDKEQEWESELDD